MPQPASAGHQLVDPRGEQLMAFRIAERAHSASQTPAVSEVMVHRGLFLLVRVPPVPFPASGLSSGAFLLEAFPVPHRQHPTAGIAELADHVRGAALVSDVQIHGPVTLLLAVLRHGRPLESQSKKTAPPPNDKYCLSWNASPDCVLHWPTSTWPTSAWPSHTGQAFERLHAANLVRLNLPFLATSATFPGK